MFDISSFLRWKVDRSCFFVDEREEAKTSTNKDDKSSPDFSLLAQSRHLRNLSLLDIKIKWQS